MMRKGMAAAALAFALALPAFACPQAAFADEPAEGDNAVNVTQLPDSSFIYDTSITDLSTADTYYDKQTVQAGAILAGLQLAGHAVVDVTTREADLEDVFLELTGTPLENAKG